MRIRNFKEIIYYSDSPDTTAYWQRAKMAPPGLGLLRPLACFKTSRLLAAKLKRLNVCFLGIIQEDEEFNLNVKNLW